MSGRYEELRASHRWEVPERYNIATDVCDKHPRDKLAMVHEHFDGTVREVLWGELQDLANQAAHVLRANGVKRGDRVAVVLPPTAETAAIRPSSPNSSRARRNVSRASPKLAPSETYARRTPKG